MRTLGAVFGALAALVAGCADSAGEKQSESGTATFESAPCPKTDPAGSSKADLGPEFSCGFLVVPENRDRPKGRTIKVAIAVPRLSRRPRNPTHWSTSPAARAGPA
jgi:hypothetical protein